MRCLTLADALKAQGAECYFVCREHSGNLRDLINSRGYDVHVLPFNDVTGNALDQPYHSFWLGASQETDATETSRILELLNPCWVVVDHYALDVIWEKKIKINGRKLMVIDDLADRQHISDILLDQTFGRNPADYSGLVPSESTLLCGSKYALLRPDFIKYRTYSLNRRAEYKLEQLIVSLGGVDKDNVTRKVLESLEQTALPKSCCITVVMGATAPWLTDIQFLASTLPWNTEVLVSVNGMAQIMAESDLAIGAAGSTSWERCCLGLPTVMVVLAENQRFAANLLEHAKAIVNLPLDRNLPLKLKIFIDKAILSSEFLKDMSENSRVLVDGAGCAQVLNALAYLSAVDK